MATLSGHASYLEQATQFNLELADYAELSPLFLIEHAVSSTAKFTLVSQTSFNLILTLGIKSNLVNNHLSD